MRRLMCAFIQPTRKGEVMGNVTTIGIDLAKNSFSVHGVDGKGLWRYARRRVGVGCLSC